MLDHTSSNPNFFIFGNILQFSCDFIFGFLANGTSIKDDDVSFFFCFTIGKSAIEENCFDSGRVGVIHLASERDYVEFHREELQRIKWRISENF